MNILITGGTGFIGKHLLAMLTSTDHRIFVLSRKENKDYGNVQFIRGDIADPGLAYILPDNIHLLVNLAAAKQEARNLEKINMEGSRLLTNWITDSGVRHVIHLSSVGVIGKQYASTRVVIDENSACEPKNEYERTKLASEKIFLQAAGNDAFRLTILRPTNVFGEYHPADALLNFFQRIQSGRALPYSRKAMVNYVYVLDVCDVIVHFINHNAEGVFNVGHPASFHEMVTWSGQALGIRKAGRSISASLLKVITPLSPSSSMRGRIMQLTNCVEYTDAKLESQFLYRYGLKSGLERTIAYYKKAGKL